MQCRGKGGGVVGENGGSERGTGVDGEGGGRVGNDGLSGNSLAMVIIY